MFGIFDNVLGAGSRLFGLPSSSMSLTTMALGVVGFFLLLTFLEALITKAV